MPLSAAATGSAVTPARDPIRVMVVDDAVVVRGMIARWIESEPDLKIVASLRTGREAIEQVERAAPHVVVLDVDMPDIDGITALPQLLEKKRDLVVLMASTLTRRNAEISLRALSLGAADYIPKPQTHREFTNSLSFRRELIDKIRALGAPRGRSPGARPAPLPLGPAAALARLHAQEAAPALAPASPAGPRLRPFPPILPRVLLIGASTGGPQAVNTVITGLGSVVDQAPVLITQHMPPTFTTIFAEHLARASGRPVQEGAHGEPVRAGRIYVAPGGRHMRVVRLDGEPHIALDDTPPINFCKPAVDPLFSSAAGVWGSCTLAVVLTGMGTDGTRGAADIVAAGGAVVVQDEASSVVWGMPGSVTHAGLCAAVLPIGEIAPKVVRLFAGIRT
jgi:two-component system chemotaxis response regulator CheB